MTEAVPPRPRPGRKLGVDLGSRRIGLAVSDSLGVLASPIDVLTRSGDEARDHTAIFETARDERCVAIVVGMPTSLSGAAGAAGMRTVDEVERMRVAAGEEFEIVTYDERFTTVIAHQQLGEVGVRSRNRKDKVDGVAAAVMLQGYLERTR
jgi:putative Holliday junction resolvase